LPNGTNLPSWPGSSPINTSDPWVITTQYSAAGIASIDTAAGGVVLLNTGTAGASNNVACPHNGSNLSNVPDPKITITLVDSTSDVWVVIPPGTRQVNAKAFDSNGNLLDEETSGAGRINLSNVSGITRVELNSAFTGGTYCFDNLMWQELWY